MRLNGKRVDLNKLETELSTAGVQIRGLGLYADNLTTFDTAGVSIDLPAAAAPVVAAHTPPAPIVIPDFGTDILTPDQYDLGVNTLRQYLANSAPTAAQTVVVVKMLCRAILFMLKRVLV